MAMLSFLFNTKPKTASAAKERLQVIIARERNGFDGPDFLPALHKELIGDLYRAKRQPALLEAAGKKELVPELQSIADELLKEPARFVDILRDKRKFVQANYTTCMQDIENEGHRFGEDLPDADKKALTAFLATL